MRQRSSLAAVFFLLGSSGGAAAQAAPSCPSGLVPTPVLPTANAQPKPSEKPKCITPQEAMQLVIAAQSDLLKQLTGQAQIPAQAGRDTPTMPGAAVSAAPTIVADPEANTAARPIAALASETSISSSLAKGRLVLRSVKFSADGEPIAPAADEIARLAKALIATEGLFAIEAHVPLNGRKWSDARTISSNRAEALVSELVKAGVPAGRLAAVGYGAGRPETHDDNTSRIEIVRLM